MPSVEPSAKSPFDAVKTKKAPHEVANLAGCFYSCRPVHAGGLRLRARADGLLLGAHCGAGAG